MALSIARLLIVATLGVSPAVLLSPGSAFGDVPRRSVACCPAPVPDAHMNLYRHVGTRWVSARGLHLGDRLLLVLLLRWNPRPYVDNRGWDAPSARLVIRKDRPYTEFHPQVERQGVLYVGGPMPRSRLPHRYNRFHMEVDLPRHASRWQGRLEFEFEVTNGTGNYGFYLNPVSASIR